MPEKIKICIISLVLIAYSACGYDYDWMKGEFEGSTTLSRKNSSSIETIRTGTGKVNFAAPFYARLGSNTPLPDCNLNFTSEKEPFKYSLDVNGVEYRGESNDGKGCAAYLIEGDAIPVEINWAEMSYDKKGGELIMKLNFNIREDSLRNYEFEFRGRKKSWLW